MSVVGIGTDIVAIARMRSALDRHGERFARRILAPEELEEWRRRGETPGLLAKRFAAKEAAAKALGTGIAEGVTLKSITVAHDSLGKPRLALAAGAVERARALGVVDTHLSLSDEREFAVAFVVLEGR
ncbi:holo-ACP synthase [Ectothiorhodospiraceae bacterium WFHF3C12]|nr:holo-ACP synthase [Ectothiorhodospiraceae bacterium WFHF3C12]